MPDAPAEEEKDTEDAPIDREVPSKPAESEATVTVQGGRRRGRRKVMKKKKVKDEDGYLGKLTLSHLCYSSLTLDSHERRSGLGVFFGRRTRAQETQAHSKTHDSKREEGACQRSREHRKFFQKGMKEVCCLPTPNQLPAGCSRTLEQVL